MTVLSFGQGRNHEKWERVIAEMTKANEGDTITFRSKKGIEWSDFKMQPDLNNVSKAHIELTFGVFVEKVNVWTGVVTVECYGGMRRDLSWINLPDKSEQLLEYFQLKYKIGHYFAKKSETEINSRKINAGNRNRINGIIETHINGRDEALNEFDIESDYGNNKEVIEKWKKKIINNEI